LRESAFAAIVSQISSTSWILSGIDKLRASVAEIFLMVENLQSLMSILNYIQNLDNIFLPHQEHI